MQNKKPLLQRLLVIYITFFIVLVASVAHGILPNFTRGAAEGVEMGNDIAEKWKSGIPRMIYMLSDIQITEQPGNTLAITSAPGVEISASVKRLGLIVEQDAPGASPLGLAFRSVGGSAWLYALVMLVPLLYLGIIVLMFVIIHSLRRSIREERTLDKRNVWYLRTIGQRLYLLRSEVDPADAEAVEPKLRDIQVDLKYEDGVQHVILNGEDVSGLIRTPEVSMAASACASVPAVRKFLFSAQVDMAKKYNVIMDGRDIGTTILPNAQVKIFLTASPEVRAERRYKELKEKGVDVSYEETLADVIRRDKQDEKQSKAAEDSILLDNSELDFNGTVKRLLEIVEERTGVKHG